MVSVDYLITTAIKEAIKKNNEQIPLPQLVLLTKPEMILYNLK